MPPQLMIPAQYFSGFFLTYFLYAKAFNVDPESRESVALMLLCVWWPVALMLLAVIAFFVTVCWLRQTIMQRIKQ